MGVLRAWIRVVLVVLACVASGTLECGGKTMTATQARGAALYDRMCAVCHGMQGEGYVADNAPAIANPRFLSMVTDPDYLQVHSHRAAALADSRLIACAAGF